MAKFTVETTETNIVKTLEFMGKKFVNTWIEEPYGARTVEKSFQDQVKTEFPNLDDYEMEQIEILDYGDKDEVKDAISELSDYERCE